LAWYQRSYFSLIQLFKPVFTFFKSIYNKLSKNTKYFLIVSTGIYISYLGYVIYTRININLYSNNKYFCYSEVVHDILNNVNTHPNVSDYTDCFKQTPLGNYRVRNNVLEATHGAFKKNNIPSIISDCEWNVLNDLPRKRLIEVPIKYDWSISTHTLVCVSLIYVGLCLIKISDGLLT